MLENIIIILNKSAMFNLKELLFLLVGSLIIGIFIGSEINSK